MSELTARQRNRIFSNVEDKLVDKLCAQMIDGKTMSAHLKENLTTVINKVLSESKNTSKISTTIFQSVNTSLQHVLNGPLLLYTLLEYDETFQQVKTTITTVFRQVFQSTDNTPQQQLAMFVDKLIGELQNPPMKVWFSAENTQQKGGGKRRVTRGRRQIVNKNITRKQHGGLFGEQTRQRNAALDKKYASRGGNTGDVVNDAVSVVADVPPEAPEAGDASVAVAEGVQNEEGAQMGVENEQTRSSAAPEMSAHSENQMADDLLVKYETNLLESLSKNIPTESDKILQKVLNASYVYATANGDTILKSITDTLRETILNDPIMSPNGSGRGMSRGISIIISVIIIQSLFSAYKDVKQAILDVYNELVEQNENPEVPPEFLPTTPEFVASFVGKLKENIGKKVRLE